MRYSKVPLIQYGVPKAGLQSSARLTGHKGVRSGSASQLDSGTALSAKPQRLRVDAMMEHKWRNKRCEGGLTKKPSVHIQLLSTCLASFSYYPLNLFLLCFFSNLCF